MQILGILLGRIISLVVVEVDNLALDCFRLVFRSFPYQSLIIVGYVALVD